MFRKRLASLLRKFAKTYDLETIFAKGPHDLLKIYNIKNNEN